MTPTAIDARQFWQQGGWKNIGRIEEEVEVMETEF